MTKKGKIEHYDSLKAQHDKLQIAIYDLTCATKFPFIDRVTIDGAREIDETFCCVVRVSVSHRSMPVYMVEFMGMEDSKKVSDVQFWYEGELSDNRDNTDTFFRVIRHAQWKQSRLRAA